MSDESMFNAFDFMGLALEEAEEPPIGPEHEGVLHHAPDFSEENDLHEEY